MCLMILNFSANSPKTGLTLSVTGLYFLAALRCMEVTSSSGMQCAASKSECSSTSSIIKAKVETGDAHRGALGVVVAFMGGNRVGPFWGSKNAISRGEKDLCETYCAVTELRDETGKETEGERDNKRDEDGVKIENESKMERE